MKKLFTLACALFGLTATMNAASVDDLKELKHSYVLVCDDWTNNGSVRPGKGNLFGDDYFLDVTGGSVATNKGSFDLAVVDGVIVTEEIAAKYGEDYGGVAHFNCLRLKQAQDVIAMKVTAQSKVIIIYQHGGNEARWPKFAKDEKLTEPLEQQGVDAREGSYGRMEWTAPDDMLVYVGDNGGDMWVGFIIVEANEAPGTPSVKVGPQTYDNGLWFKEVTCTPVNVEMDGISIPSVVTYTTDGTEPTAASPVYKEPIKCYSNMIVKFQAFMDAMGDGTPMDIYVAPGADNEAAINFIFDAPTITANGGNVEINTEYGNAENYYTVADGNGNAIEEDVAGSTLTLSESATVTAYTVIENGGYATFKTNSVTQDVYVLNPIKEKKTIVVTAGTAVLDEEATANSTTGPVYKVEGGEISADKMDFYVKSPMFAVVKDEKYQIDGKECYLQMQDPMRISFEVAEGDSVNVKVVCSLNSCKTFNADDDPEVTTDRQCSVNVSGTTYTTTKTETNEDGEEVQVVVPVNEGGNVIEFGLTGGQVYTFQKYSGTGNIMVASIEITPVEGGANGISSAVVEKNVNAPVYNLAGQKVDASYKGIVIQNGKKHVQK